MFDGDLKMQNCRFCNIASGIYEFNEVDQPFHQSISFMAIASIGAFIKGWTLIVPKKHQLSMKNEYTNAEFQKLTDEVLDKMIDTYGSIIAFEHGSNHKGSITACGTDHAHLHLVPFKDSLLQKMQATNLEWIKCRASEIKQKVNGKEYLFYYEIGINKNWSDAEGYLHILKVPISQFFRKLIAEYLELSEVANYRDNPFLLNAQQTQHILYQLCS